MFSRKREIDSGDNGGVFQVRWFFKNKAKEVAPIRAALRGALDGPPDEETWAPMNSPVFFVRSKAFLRSSEASEVEAAESCEGRDVVPGHFFARALFDRDRFHLDFYRLSNPFFALDSGLGSRNLAHRDADGTNSVSTRGGFVELCVEVALIWRSLRSTRARSDKR